MATLAANVLTLADWAKRIDPDGKTPVIVELLGQTNEILTDMLYAEGNLPTGHRVHVRTGLPTTAWRLLNQGVQPSKSTTAQIDEHAGMLEAWSEVDVDLAELNGNTDAFRLSEAKAFIEAMNQEMASTLFYGNAGVSPEEFTGLAVRYSDKSAANGKNIIDAGGTGSDNSSIYLVGWGENSIFGIFPKGSKAGLTHNNFGAETVETTAGVGATRMRAYRDQFVWKNGIALKDWRYTARIANIDISLAVAGSVDIIDKMIDAIHVIQNLNMVKPVFYMNRTLFGVLDHLRRDDVISGGQLTYKDVDGKIIPTFRQIPIRICDALLENEDQVT